MPKVYIKVIGSEQVWQSPDKQRTIYKLEAETEDGKSLDVQTFSEKITDGFEGEVETYERGRNTFVRQLPKEDESGQYASRTQTGSAGGRPQYRPPQSDPFTMYLSYAKDIAVALLQTDSFSKKKLLEVIENVNVAGKALYEERPEATRKENAKPKEEKASVEDDVDTDEQTSIDA